MHRKGDILDVETPPTGVAYRKYRSTTEHVSGTKMVIEGPISVKNEATHLLLLDMTNACDSINRNLLKETKLRRS